MQVPRLEDAEAAAVSTIGIVLLVAMSVTVGAAPFVYMKLSEGVSDPIATGTRTALAAGSGSWGDGDEVVEIAHKSGRKMEAASVDVVITVNGVRTVVPGTAGSADGTLFADAGAPWRHPMNIPAGAEVHVEIHWQPFLTEQLIVEDVLTAPGDVGGGGGGSAGSDDGDDEDEAEGDDDVGSEPVVICHIPHGNPDAAHDLSIDASALQTHLAHGDHQGACDGTEGGEQDESGDDGAHHDGDGEDADESDSGGDEDDGADDEDGFTICHIPPGNPDNAHTITVGSQGAVDAHVGHGDQMGPCEDD